MQIFIGNLPLKTTDEELKAMFVQFGTVLSANIGRNKKTEEPEGYGIVEMKVKHEARAAVDALRGKEMEGKPLLVRILKPEDEFHDASRSRGFSGGGSGQSRTGGAQRGSAIMRRGGQRGG